MDNFSPAEQRMLSLIERELDTDLRLVALMTVLGGRGSRLWRRVRCLGVRLRFACQRRDRRPRV